MEALGDVEIKPRDERHQIGIHQHRTTVHIRYRSCPLATRLRLRSVPSPSTYRDPGRVAIGAWGGGRFMHFGERIDDQRFTALVAPGGGIDTIITADVYGAGEADTAVGEAIAGLPRDEICVVGAVGHDFYEGRRNGPKGFPRFTDRALRGPDGYADYLSMATERSLQRCGVDRFDLLLLHNPDRIGYTSDVVWNGMAALRADGLTRMIGVAPGPANGFTLDLIGCLERYGALLDWAMVILNPLEPWPGELVMGAAAAAGVQLITRVVDYGGLFFDDLMPGQELARGDHRGFRPAGWIEAGRDRLEPLRPIAERAGLTMIQLACQWNLAHAPVACAAPTLIQEVGPQAKSIEAKRAELAALPSQRLTDDDVATIRAIGDNTGSMLLKGASPEFSGDEQPDRWTLDEHLESVAARWEIEPSRDLTQRVAA